MKLHKRVQKIKHFQLSGQKSGIEQNGSCTNLTKLPQNNINVNFFCASSHDNRNSEGINFPLETTLTAPKINY